MCMTNKKKKKKKKQLVMCSYSTEVVSELGLANLKLTIGSVGMLLVDRLSFF